MHHWPPSVVDEQPWWLIEQLPPVAQAYAEAQDLRIEREQAQAERENR